MVRLKNRYFLVQIAYPESTAFKPANDSVPDRVRFHPPTPDRITHHVLLRKIRDQVAVLFGDYGAGVAAGQLGIKYFSNATSTFILRCPRAHFRLVWAALSMMTELVVPAPKDGAAGDAEALSCVMRVLHVSGTIRKAEDAAIKAARESIHLVTQAAGGSQNLLDRVLPVSTGGGDEDENEASSDAHADVTMNDEAE